MVIDKTYFLDCWVVVINSNFTNTDKDYLLIDIDKDLRKLYPQLLASINLGVYSLLRIRYKLGLLFIRLLRRL